MSSSVDGVVVQDAALADLGAVAVDELDGVPAGVDLVLVELVERRDGQHVKHGKAAGAERQRLGDELVDDALPAASGGSGRRSWRRRCSGPWSLPGRGDGRIRCAHRAQPVDEPLAAAVPEEPVVQVRDLACCAAAFLPAAARYLCDQAPPCVRHRNHRHDTCNSSTDPPARTSATSAGRQPSSAASDHLFVSFSSMRRLRRSTSSRGAFLQRLELAVAGRHQALGRDAAGDQILHDRGGARAGQLPVGGELRAGDAADVGVAVDLQRPVDFAAEWCAPARRWRWRAGRWRPAPRPSWLPGRMGTAPRTRTRSGRRRREYPCGRAEARAAGRRNRSGSAAAPAPAWPGRR